jgi:NAD(P)-dependent dehydrogenase (short-subunit alcohol dehydrogenase family)
MNHSFENQTGLVTGGGSGIGLATARAFAEAGAAVALIDIDENAIGSAAEQLRSAGHKAIALRCDVSDEDAVAAIVHQTISKFGQLDFAFNNAGIQVPVAETADARGEDFDRLMAINLRGVWACMKHELRHMRDQGSGAIVNCSSSEWISWRRRSRRVYRLQAWRDRLNEKRCSRVCGAGYPDQRNMSGGNRHTHGRRCAGERTGDNESRDEGDSVGSTRQF